MKKTLFLMCLVMLLSVAFTAIAQARTVGLVVAAKNDRPAATDKALSINAEFLTKNQVALVYGEKVDAALKEMGVALTPETVGNKDILVQLGQKLGVDAMMGIYDWTWVRYHIGGYDAPIDFSMLVVDVNSGAVIDNVIGARLKKNADNQEARAAKVVGIAAGVTVATGRLIGSAAYRNPFGYNVRAGGGVFAAGLLFIPTKSRCSTEIGAMRKAAEVVIGPIIPKLK